MAQALRITTLGLVSAVGLAPESAAAAMRAGIAGFADLPYADGAGEPIVGAPVPDLPANLRGRARLVELLARALQAAVERLPEGLAPDRLPLLLCTREAERPGARLKGIMAEVEQRLGLAFHREGSRHVASGPVAPFEALGHARQLLAGRPTEACLIAAVDSLCEPRALHWYERAKRLKTSTESDGIIPGEAAAVALVAARPLTPPQLTLRGLGFGVEKATVLSEEPLRGEGMTAAVRAALAEAGVAMHDVDFRLSDVAGESYAFEELVLVQTRLSRKTRPRQELWLPAGMAGDCGAAAGLLQLAWFEQTIARGYAPGPIALAHASAAMGARAAALIGQ